MTLSSSLALGAAYYGLFSVLYAHGIRIAAYLAVVRTSARVATMICCTQSRPISVETRGDSLRVNAGSRLARTLDFWLASTKIARSDLRATFPTLSCVEKWVDFRWLLTARWSWTTLVDVVLPRWWLNQSFPRLVYFPMLIASGCIVLVWT